MTIYNNSFFQDDISVKRRDGHVANAIIPIGNHIYLDTSDAVAVTITPPEGAVGFYGRIKAGGGLRFTLDGVTTPSADIGFNSIAGGGFIYIRPGTALKVKAATAQTAGTSGINIQWCGSV